MEWLLALIVVLFAAKSKGSSSSSKPPKSSGGYVDAPTQKGMGGAALFWQHKTAAGFELVGYCDNVTRSEDRVLFNNLVAIDLTQKGGVDSPKFLSVPFFNLNPVNNAAMGCVILPELIAAGALDGKAGCMLFDDPAVGKKTWVDLGRHSLEISRKTPDLYQVTDDSDWTIFWAGSEPWPVNVEITPAGIGA
jgi:hypothetical protein